MIKILPLLILGLIVTGCSSIGNAPEPMTNDQVASEIEKKSPQEQIQFWQSAPMLPDVKKQKIDAVKAKYNLSDADVEAAKSQGGAPAGTGTPR